MKRKWDRWLEKKIIKHFEKKGMIVGIVSTEHDTLYAVRCLQMFSRFWCMNAKKTMSQDEPIFRCKNCKFQCTDGTCQAKMFIKSVDPGAIRDFGLTH